MGATRTQREGTIDLPRSMHVKRPAAPRHRRQPGQVRRLLLDAARDLFEEKGYARATTREITSRAGVAETLLFRNFGSKANLFAEAVLLPLADFFRDWVHEFTGQETSPDVEEAQYQFNKSLYDMASANRGLLLTFFATAVFEPEVLAAPDAIATITRALDDLAFASRDELVRLGVDLRDYDVVSASRAVVCMILAVALFGPVILPSGKEARTDNELLHELTRLVLFGGLNQRPASVGGGTPRVAERATTRGPARQPSPRNSISAAAVASGASSQKK
jgi:AcrR family transcriptional regulator